MDGGADLPAEGDSEQRKFDRIEGEIDAALVFAGAAQEAFHIGNVDLGITCLADATDCQADALTSLSQVNLPAEHIQALRAKLLLLDRLLEPLRPSGRNEAA